MDLTCDVSALRTELVGPPGDSGEGVGGWEPEPEPEESLGVGKSEEPGQMQQGGASDGGEGDAGGADKVQKEEGARVNASGEEPGESRVQGKLGKKGGKEKEGSAPKKEKDKASQAKGVVDIATFLSRYRVQGAVCVGAFAFVVVCVDLFPGAVSIVGVCVYVCMYVSVSVGCVLLSNVA